MVVLLIDTVLGLILQPAHGLSNGRRKELIETDEEVVITHTKVSEI